MSELIPTIPVLGLPVAALNLKQVVSQVTEWAELGDRAYAIEAADVHVITRSRHEADFGSVMQKFDLVCPDGMPVLWSINSQLSQEEKLVDRVCGADIMASTIERSYDNKLSHFLLGGSEELLNKLEGKLTERYPKAKIAATYSPPFGEWPEDELERICKKIIESGARFIWVGLGCPKQESWISKNKEELPPGCYFGVGAAFAFHAGEISRAPTLFRKTGMEWFYRLCKEPRRLWKRYFYYNTLFLVSWIPGFHR